MKQEPTLPRAKLSIGLDVFWMAATQDPLSGVSDQSRSRIAATQVRQNAEHHRHCQLLLADLERRLLYRMQLAGLAGAHDGLVSSHESDSARIQHSATIVSCGASNCGKGTAIIFSAVGRIICGTAIPKLSPAL